MPAQRPVTPDNLQDALAILAEVRQLADEGLHGDRTHYGALFAIERVLNDHAPANYRERLA